MSLKLLAKGLSKTNGLNVKQEFNLLKQRQEDIKLNGFFTAFVIDKIRQEENKKLGGEK